MLSGMFFFMQARTAVMPNRSASALVTAGPYRFSRNPMYVGLTGAYVGGVLLTNNAWCLIMLPVVLSLIHCFVIRREELYLEAEFGKLFLSYRARVRRWL
jgi:protein-S-isoprenylcysteine O-methyltransferase Ste14